MRRLAGLIGAALFSALSLIFVFDRLGRSWEARVAVRGHSMEPTLVAGDWLLVDPDAYRGRAPRVGELVVARDPRDGQRILVKRLIAVRPGGRLNVAGDHPAHADEGASIGEVEQTAI
ncbi:MAG: S26 family signal peptidase, partial [Chloroflexi bacterium]|nr:S26 family signal peptidase [Chloroflexota bacterium]